MIIIVITTHNTFITMTHTQTDLQRLDELSQVRGQHTSLISYILPAGSKH